MRRSRRTGRTSGILVLVSALLLGAWACASDPNTRSAGPLVEVLGVTRLQAQDPKALADWYSSRFRLTFQPDGSGYLSKDDTALGPLTIAIDQAPEGQKPGRIEIFFYVRNLDRVLGQLSDQGTAPLRLDTDDQGRPKAVVLDPEGNRIELVQR